MEIKIPLPGYPGYTITANGNIHYKDQLKKLIRKPGRSVKIRLKQKGIAHELGVAKLLAQAFLPNPQNHTRIIFKDGNHHNCNLDNIQWAGHIEFSRYSLFPGKPLLIAKTKKIVKEERTLAALKVKAPCKQRDPSRFKSVVLKNIFIDPLRVPVPGCPGYYITPQGCVYFQNKQIAPKNSNSRKSVNVKIIVDGVNKYFGLAKLMATAFIPNPGNHSRILFKDRNNKNCLVENIAWAGNKEHNAYIQSFKTNSLLGQSVDEVDADRKPIPGYPGYYITPGGKVYYRERLLYTKKGKGRADRVLLTNSGGKQVYITVAKLIAVVFIPNPDNHREVIFIDRNKNNCIKENIQWVSLSDFNRYKHCSNHSEDLLGPVKHKKPLASVWIDPKRIPLESFPGYYITPHGVVYRQNKIIKPIAKKGKSLKVRLKVPGMPAKTFRWLGLATLLAEHFIPNPKNHRHIIFKDRDNHNCIVENIAWVDGQTFMYYAGLSNYQTGRKKIVVDRNEAIRICTDMHLKQYYKTLDEYWLAEGWKHIEAKVNVADWEHLRSESYMYFIDRAKRFSILKNPVGLVLVHLKGIRSKLKKEISPDIPFGQLFKTDESLRTIKRGNSYYDSL